MPRICIVGAGIAGLVSAKVLRRDGFEVTVFEQNSEPGGVWASSNTYPGLRANNPKQSYAFSDFPYPDNADEYPTAAQIRGYLGAYIQKNDLQDCIYLSHKILRISEIPDTGNFLVEYVKPNGAKPEISEFEFVVVCSGVFSTASLPRFDNQAAFTGELLHSSQFNDLEQISNKKIVVIGAGKSALDCATMAANYAKECILVVREPRWMVPQYFPGGVRADYVIMTRVAEAFLRYPTQNRFERLLHGLGFPLLWTYWAIANVLIRGLLRFPDEMKPSTRLPYGLENIGVGAEFYRALRRGELKVRRGAVKALAPEGVVLNDNRALDADTVICATGWKLDLWFLSPELRQLVCPQDQLLLYRHSLCVDKPKLAFNGFQSSIACQLGSEVTAHWISDVFSGKVQLPERKNMIRTIEHDLQILGSSLPLARQGYYIGPFISHYVDDLMRDMKLPTRRKRGFFREYFSPFWADRYKTLHEERRVRTD